MTTTSVATAPVVLKPPVWILAAAAAVLAVSALLLLLSGLWVSVLGYLLAPLGVTALVSYFRVRDIQAQQSPRYSPSQRRQQAAVALLITSVAVGCGHAWFAANEIAKAVGS